MYSFISISTNVRSVTCAVHTFGNTSIYFDKIKNAMVFFDVHLKSKACVVIKVILKLNYKNQKTMFR